MAVHTVHTIIRSKQGIELQKFELEESRQQLVRARLRVSEATKALKQVEAAYRALHNMNWIADEIATMPTQTVKLHSCFPLLSLFENHRLMKNAPVF